MPRAKKSPDFEKSLAQLESLVQQMESEELSLEESLSAFEQGVKLTRECQQALAAAEQKVQILLEKNGQLKASDYRDDTAESGSGEPQE